MKVKEKVSKGELGLTSLLDSIDLSSSQMASAKGRMRQAEVIADVIGAVYTATGAAINGALLGSQILARRIKSAFVKVAHH